VGLGRERSVHKTYDLERRVPFGPEEVAGRPAKNVCTGIIAGKLPPQSTKPKGAGRHRVSRAN
jgi:hypothetical protein